MANDDRRGIKRPAGGAGGSGLPKPRVTPWLLIALVVTGLLVLNSWFSTASSDKM